VAGSGLGWLGWLEPCCCRGEKGEKGLSELDL
jgi:hypothetical protein